MSYVEKEWKKATITDNFMFRLVMESEELCKTLIERVLNIKISKLSYVEHEKSFELKLDGKGTRLDLYVTDEDGTAYDVEMQTNNSSTEHLGKRTRYYGQGAEISRAARRSEFRARSAMHAKRSGVASIAHGRRCTEKRCVLS
ncbi:MAG: PD-(D/E)XK nuclease family transposase [Synergistes sp.]|nr:PD-(D/E)XK nuclease family transposase [Synergistes sp.]